MIMQGIGATEAANPVGELFSDERLRKVLAKSGEIGLQEVLGDHMAPYASAGADDITLTVIEYRGCDTSAF